MATLAEVFRSYNSRVTKTLVAVDLSNATAMKEQQPEATWLTTYAWFFDKLHEGAVDHHGKIIKVLPEGALAVFSEDHVAEAINWAIALQEAIADAQERNQVNCECSVGVAFGEVVEFELGDGSGAKDYIGTVVDKALRLCSAANAKAVFVDVDAVTAAAMNKVRSRIGGVMSPKRKVADYLGPAESIKAKGFSRPVPYHEILWGSARYGIKGSFVTGLSAPPIDDAPLRSSLDRTPTSANPWVRGRVKSLGDRYGFIGSEAGEDFWFNGDQLFRRAAPVRVGDDVWFIPAEPYPNSKNRRATEIIAFGAQLDGVLEKIMPQGFGFASCKPDFGEPRTFFMNLGDSGRWTPGTPVTFRMGENKKGPAGWEVRSKSA